MKIINKTILIIFFVFMFHNKSFDENTWWANKGKNIVTWIKDNPIKFLLTVLAVTGIWKIKTLHQEWKEEAEKKKIQETEKNNHKHKIKTIVEEYQQYVDNEYNSMGSQSMSNESNDKNLIKVKNDLEKVPSAYLFILRMKKIFEFINKQIKKEMTSNTINNIEDFMQNINNSDNINQHPTYLNIIVYFVILEFVNNELKKIVQDILKKKNYTPEILDLINYERNNNLVLEAMNNPFPFYVRAGSKNIETEVCNFNTKYKIDMHKQITRQTTSQYAVYNPLLSYLLRKKAIYINPYCKQKNNKSDNRRIFKKIIKEEYTTYITGNNNITLAGYIDALVIKPIGIVTNKILKQLPPQEIPDHVLSLLKTVEWKE